MGISLGLVGLGMFGSSFADLFKSHPLVDRIALCDREPERIARFADKPAWRDKFSPSDVYDSLDAILKTDLDALVVITQPWLHAPQCIQAMLAGKHVYSAVPIITLPDGSETLDWCDKLVATCRKTGMHYMLGETTYFRPEAMYCRRKAREGAFGQFVYSEGEYFHDVDEPGCNLRDVYRNRLQGKAGQDGLALQESYRKRGIKSGPMHYPTHSTSGPMCVMNAHAVKVCCWGKPSPDDAYFSDSAFSDETALFHMSNGATMRICEHREIGVPGRETFRIYGTQGSFENGSWLDKHRPTPQTIEQMRDPLPTEVAEAFRAGVTEPDFYGGHGGSHAYLVNEFVDAIAHGRAPATNAWEAVRYMAAGVMAHKSALRDGELLAVPDWGDAPGSVTRESKPQASAAVSAKP
jgi:predicted dehydrogenase